MRAGIIRDFAAWTALSALRSGSPVKDRARIYGGLEAVDWTPVFDVALGQVTEAEFGAWHAAATEVLLNAVGSGLPMGWAVKLINVYLKTACYVGELGRPGVRALLHPPIDAGLWRGLEERFGVDSPVCRDTHCVQKIKDIKTYDTYLRIIDGCRRAAAQDGRALIEVEEWWGRGR